VASLESWAGGERGQRVEPNEMRKEVGRGSRSVGHTEEEEDATGGAQA
jgi:hypothetical protein